MSTDLLKTKEEHSPAGKLRCPGIPGPSSGCCCCCFGVTVRSVQESELLMYAFSKTTTVRFRSTRFSTCNKVRRSEKTNEILCLSKKPLELFQQLRLNTQFSSANYPSFIAEKSSNKPHDNPHVTCDSISSGSRGFLQNHVVFWQF